jgi:hypothetical protein
MCGRLNPLSNPTANMSKDRDIHDKDDEDHEIGQFRIDLIMICKVSTSATGAQLLSRCCINGTIKLV